MVDHYRVLVFLTIKLMVLWLTFIDHVICKPKNRFLCWRWSCASVNPFFVGYCYVTNSFNCKRRPGCFGWQQYLIDIGITGTTLPCSRCYLGATLIRQLWRRLLIATRSGLVGILMVCVARQTGISSAMANINLMPTDSVDGLVTDQVWINAAAVAAQRHGYDPISNHKSIRFLFFVPWLIVVMFLLVCLVASRSIAVLFAHMFCSTLEAKKFKDLQIQNPKR